MLPAAEPKTKTPNTKPNYPLIFLRLVEDIVLSCLLLGLRILKHFTYNLGVPLPSERGVGLGDTTI